MVRKWIEPIILNVLRENLSSLVSMFELKPDGYYVIVLPESFEDEDVKQLLDGLSLKKTNHPNVVVVQSDKFSIIEL